jgi:hypothetical protein
MKTLKRNMVNNLYEQTITNEYTDYQEQRNEEFYFNSFSCYIWLLEITHQNIFFVQYNHVKEPEISKSLYLSKGVINDHRWNI